ncbi:geranylgeranyl reductase family protein [Methanocorpusculum vombati]|uniref:NAD(P)/FAD-dependent oxidoreductase n=1 Tax=Methanocorpusculum vombati TaxID=3002864 RepID=A0ABT4IMD7_9EURY|nr:NAD(P)/FAD-dependent oxidoreductase [Methanocorpusculum vombati]MCZ9319647.1 NAD(P)/FAD-dependent oxidoreductase [Methanocorpusculum sp.]MCZ0862914.1 NAD(P)/FAD-dependent oxidoreductase [Methanocorpusculum vombati]MDE2520891.1 NAD(P)/FAD-dependent oxidoreductase [Methanocorpusculum sp.]MDE2533666.1 NAD(P)/FAD-dependent oxidoreductase [Methanocorpusculum sp.]MDE2546891.1 NAD(P)/FAD-dependent oxidoreductase [Methanocorpusculum sp.]
MYDVIIAGAGPTGSTAARLCADAGLATLVLEEHAAIGYPVQCAGLLSSSAFRECEVSDASVLNTVRGARICGSAGHELFFAADTTKAYVVDRGRLDHEMAARAADAGAEFALKTCVTAVNPQKRTLSVTGVSGKQEIPYNILIAADGPRSVIARGLGIAPSRYIYAGVQAEVSWNGSPDFVELFPNASPDFFAWVIPLSARRARIGLCGMRDVPARFAAFAKQFSPANIHEVTGTVPIGVRSRTWGAGCMIAGDAAGFPKPTSGGGVYTGVRSARHAAAVAVAAAETGDVSDPVLAEYEKRWRADFGRELDLGFKALSFRRTLTAEEIDSAIDALNTPETRELITTAGDMDRPSALLLKLMRNPEIVSTFGVLGIKSMIRSMII